MATRARGPHVLKGAIVTIGDSQPTPKVIAFQYNPSTLKRSLQPQMVGGEENDRSEAVRYTGAPVQTMSVDIEIDAADWLDHGSMTAETLGVLPQLAALELLIYPTTDQINQNHSKLAQGIMEVSPMTAPRALFVWGTKRVVPIRLQSFSVSEEMFDQRLRPIRATVSLSMRILNYSDLDSSNKEYHEFMAYQQNMQVMSSSAYDRHGQADIGVDPSTL